MDDGRRVAGASGRYGDIFNPSVGEKSGRVAFASAVEVDAAVQAAREALPKWAAVTPLRRARIMFRLKDLLEQNIDIRLIQVLLGHAKLETTALYTQVATNVIRAVMSPLDRLTPLTAQRSEPPA